MTTKLTQSQLDALTAKAPYYTIGKDFAKITKLTAVVMDRRYTIAQRAQAARWVRKAQDLPTMRASDVKLVRIEFECARRELGDAAFRSAYPFAMVS